MRTFILLVFAVLIVVAAVTNPSKQDHQEKVKEVVYDSYKKKSSPEEKHYIRYVNDAAIKAIVDKLIPQYVRVDNYALFSITKVKTDTENKRIGIGAFGNVFVDLPDNFLKGGRTAEE